MDILGYFYGNVACVETAKVVLLANRHGNHSIQLKNSEIVAELYQEGDIVLVEGIDGQLDASSMQIYLNIYPKLGSWMNIEGWESDLEASLHYSYIKSDSDYIFKSVDQERENVNVKQIISNVSDWTKELIIKEMQENSGNSNVTILLNVLDELSALIFDFACGEPFFRRSVALTEKILEKSDRHRKTFVLAGGAYFIYREEPEFEKEDRDIQLSAIQHLNESLICENIPYLLFCPEGY